MTRDVKYLVLALAVAATAAAVSPPTLRGAKDASGAETVGDTFTAPKHSPWSKFVLWTDQVNQQPNKAACD